MRYSYSQTTTISGAACMIIMFATECPNGLFMLIFCLIYGTNLWGFSFNNFLNFYGIICVVFRYNNMMSSYFGMSHYNFLILPMMQSPSSCQRNGVDCWLRIEWRISPILRGSTWQIIYFDCLSLRLTIA